MEQEQESANTTRSRECGHFFSVALSGRTPKRIQGQPKTLVMCLLFCFCLALRSLTSTTATNDGRYTIIIRTPAHHESLGFVPGNIFLATRGHVEEPTIVEPDRESSWQETLGVSHLITTANDVWWMIVSVNGVAPVSLRMYQQSGTPRISYQLKGSSVGNSLERKVGGRILFVLLENTLHFG
jgi:hypothetical protein